MKSVLVTGGLGYIGAHVVDALAEHGHSIDVVDCSMTLENYDFVKERCNNLWNEEVQRLSDEVSWGEHYDAIIHLAASISVEQSVREPHTYWRNNLSALWSLSFLKTDHLIFASTGTAFNPTNPYAHTKVACERYIQDLHGTPQAWFKGHTSFRFYNVSGLKEGIKPTGQPSHLIRIAALAAKGRIDGMKIYGHDYPTPDGTAIRDYIHVEDIAASICQALHHGPSNTPYECLGSGSGYSVLQVVQSMQRVTGSQFSVTMAQRREGDDVITFCPSKYKHLHITKSLDDMCLSAYLNV